MEQFLRPKTLEEAVNALATGDYRIIAGGTDLMIGVKEAGYDAYPVMDITGIDDLKGIRELGDRVEIGALTTHAELAGSELIKNRFFALWQAANMVGSPQIRNMGTIGGNIGNASPSADTVVPLYAFEAVVVLIGPDGIRKLPIDQIFVGPKRTILNREMIVKVILPLKEGYRSQYMRLGTRAALSISKVGVAVAAKLENKKVVDVHIALGAVAPTVVYAKRAEQAIYGKDLNEQTIEQACDAVKHDATPITDIRSTASYRRAMTATLLRRVLHALI